MDIQNVVQNVVHLDIYRKHIESINNILLYQQTPIPHQLSLILTRLKQEIIHKYTYRPQYYIKHHYRYSLLIKILTDKYNRYQQLLDIHKNLIDIINKDYHKSQTLKPAYTNLINAIEHYFNVYFNINLDYNKYIRLYDKILIVFDGASSTTSEEYYDACERMLYMSEGEIEKLELNYIDPDEY